MVDGFLWLVAWSQEGVARLTERHQPGAVSGTQSMILWKWKRIALKQPEEETHFYSQGAWSP